MGYRSEFESLAANRSVGGQVTQLHAYRFTEPTISIEEIFETELAKEGSLCLEDVVKIVTLIQKASEHAVLLTGGWGVQSYNPRSLRPSSSELDLMAHTLSTFSLVKKFGLRYVSDWKSRVGFFTLPNGSLVRLEVDTFDLLPASQEINVGDETIHVASPLTITLGKLIRAHFRGVKERDQIDICSLLLSPYGDQLAKELKQQIQLDQRVSTCLSVLNIPQSVQKLFSPEEYSRLTNIFEKMWAVEDSNP